MTANIDKYLVELQDYSLDILEIFTNVEKQITAVVVDSIKQAVEEGTHIIEFAVRDGKAVILSSSRFGDLSNEYINLVDSVDDALDKFIDMYVCCRVVNNEYVFSYVENKNRLMVEIIRDNLRSNADRLDFFLKQPVSQKEGGDDGTSV